MAETINEVGDDLSTKAREATPSFAMLTCSWCDEEAFPADPAQVAKLAEHCTYEHASHVPILGVRYDVFIEGYDLAQRLGAPALTDHEQVWRMAGCEHLTETEIEADREGYRSWQCDACEFKRTEPLG